MSQVESVTKKLVIASTQAHAFHVFTEGIDRWWPRHHHIGKSPLARLVLEPRVGGRWYAICEDASECDTGKVLIWDPPRRLVLAWQINAEWKYDAAFLTEVEVTFTAEGPKTTRVELEHRHLERYGEKATDLRKAIDAPGGWGAILEQFGKIAVE